MPEEDFNVVSSVGGERHAAAAATTVSAAAMRIVRLLVGQPPQTVSDLIGSTGVTRTAVTEQLNELVAAGFVERTLERLTGRGRPRHLYTATRAALLLLFASNEQLVVPAIWRAIGEIGGEEMVDDVHHRVSHMLAEHYKPRITATAPADRLQQMAELLRREGGLVEVTVADGQLMLHKLSCAFIGMFDDSRGVCHIDEDMISEVVGQRVRRSACRHDGAACCSFELVPEDDRP